MQGPRLTLLIAGLALVAGISLVLDYVARSPDPERFSHGAPPLDPPPGAEAEASAAPELPSVGAVRVESTREGLTVRANGARRSAVIEALARAGGFTVVGATEDDPRLRLILEVADLRTAVVAILGDAAYRLDFAEAPGGGDPALIRVVLGEDAGGPRPADAAPGRAHHDGAPGSLGAAAPSDANGREAALDAAADRTPSALDAIRRKRERLLAQQRREDLALLASGNEADRVAAAFRLDAEDDESFVALSKSLGSDPSARVRARAARRLGFGESDEVLPVLTRALDDTDPDVVIEAIDAIAFGGERDAIPPLEALAAHPDPKVRAAAASALEVLR